MGLGLLPAKASPWRRINAGLHDGTSLLCVALRRGVRIAGRTSKIQNLKSKINDPAGFTLLEILLAVSIFALVVAVIFSSLRIGLGSWEKGEQDIDFIQKTRAVTELLYREINSAFPYVITPGVLDRHTSFFAFFGESDSLKWVSGANLHKRAAGLSLLELWVQEDKGLMLGEGPALAANRADLEDIDLRAEEASIPLLPEATGLSLRYFDRKPADEEGEWLERWDPQDRKARLPHFVEITITFTHNDEEGYSRRFIVPILSMSSTRT